MGRMSVRIVKREGQIHRILKKDGQEEPGRTGQVFRILKRDGLEDPSRKGQVFRILKRTGDLRINPAMNMVFIFIFCPVGSPGHC